METIPSGSGGLPQRAERCQAARNLYMEEVAVFGGSAAAFCRGSAGQREAFDWARVKWRRTFNSFCCLEDLFALLITLLRSRGS